MSRAQLVLCLGYRALHVVLVLFRVTCHGIGSSSCGNIQDISFPFQLKGDPSDTCGDSNYTLSCENNRTVLHLYSGKYYVQATNYNNYTIRVTDVGIQTNICSSFPLYPLTPLNFTNRDPNEQFATSWVVFLDCENPVYSPTYVNRTAYCRNGVDSLEWYHSYVVAGEVTLRDVADCAA